MYLYLFCLCLTQLSASRRERAAGGRSPRLRQQPACACWQRRRLQPRQGFSLRFSLRCSLSLSLSVAVVLMLFFYFFLRSPLFASFDANRLQGFPLTFSCCLSLCLSLSHFFTLSPLRLLCVVFSRPSVLLFALFISLLLLPLLPFFRSGQLPSCPVAASWACRRCALFCSNACCGPGEADEEEALTLRDPDQVPSCCPVVVASHRSLAQLVSSVLVSSSLSPSLAYSVRLTVYCFQ